MTATPSSPRRAALAIGVVLALGIVALIGIASSDGKDRKAAANDSPAYEPPPVKNLRLSCTLDEGQFISHDVYLTNTSGEDLTEVHLSIELVGENASPTVQRYWSRWSLGVQQDVSVSVDDVKNIQRVYVTGTADQGRISQGIEIRKGQ